MCHPMLVCASPASSLSTNRDSCDPLTCANSFISPYRVQEAEVAIEDTVVLSALLSCLVTLTSSRSSTSIPGRPVRTCTSSSPALPLQNRSLIHESVTACDCDARLLSPQPKELPPS